MIKRIVINLKSFQEIFNLPENTEVAAAIAMEDHVIFKISDPEDKIDQGGEGYYANLEIEKANVEDREVNFIDVKKVNRVPVKEYCCNNTFIECKNEIRKLESTNMKLVNEVSRLHEILNKEKE